MQNRMRACPHCGAQISANAQFCKACGKSVTAEPMGAPRQAAQSIARKCPICGAALSETAQFCKACGKPIELMVLPSPPSPVAAKSAAIPTPTFKPPAPQQLSGAAVSASRAAALALVGALAFVCVCVIFAVTGGVAVFWSQGGTIQQAAQSTASVHAPPIPFAVTATPLSGTAAIPSLAVTRRLPPATFVPTPSPLLQTPTKPTPAAITPRFDDSVPSDERELILNAFNQARVYFGDIGDTKVYAYSNLDALVQEHARHNGISLDSQQSKNLRLEFEKYASLGINSPGAIFIYVGSHWKSESVSVRWGSIGHEYFHSFQRYRAKRQLGDTGPFWLIEGSGEVASGRFAAKQGYSDLETLRRQAIQSTRGILNPLSLMETRESAFTEDNFAPYNMGYLAAEYLIVTYGGEPALLTKYWDTMGSTGQDWQTAFQSAFGISIGDFYRRFEDYRALQFPPYCGRVGTPSAGTQSTPFSIRFDRQHPPGSLRFLDVPLSLTSPPPVPYTFCITGIPLGTLDGKQQVAAVKLPGEASDFWSCGGACIVLYIKPNTPPKNLVLTIQLPDGRRAEVSFQHTNPP